jgi:hypothetical protein
MDDGSDIIIKGGSVELNYDEHFYPVDPSDPRRHKSDNKKIVRIRITGDLDYDSGEHPNGLRCDITVVCR